MVASRWWQRTAWRLTLVVVAAAAVAGCASTTHVVRPGGRRFVLGDIPARQCALSANGRFAVAILPPVQSAARQVGVPLASTVTASLGRIASLLPGPRTNILMVGGGDVIPGLGVDGFTDPTSGQVQINVDLHESPGTLRRSLSIWLLLVLAHEVDHSVRIQSGPDSEPRYLSSSSTRGFQRL